MSGTVTLSLVEFDKMRETIREQETKIARIVDAVEWRWKGKSLDDLLAEYEDWKFDQSLYRANELLQQRKGFP